MKTLFIYSGRDGQTLKICRFLTALLGEQQCQIVPLGDDVDLQSFDRIVIGASIRYGHFNKDLYRFINANADKLNAKRAVFFGINLTARKTGKDTAETNVYVRKFLNRIQWKPTLVGVFAGALLYPRYKWFDRVMIQFIMRITGGETDTTKEIEYTDWGKVRAFGEKIKQHYL